jgi:hypothetical protein
MSDGLRCRSLDQVLRVGCFFEIEMFVGASCDLA